MAFLKSRVSSDKERKSDSGISIKEMASLSGIAKPQAGEQGKDDVVGSGEITGGIWMGHACSILMKGDIPAVMQTRFNLPIGAFELSPI